MLFRCQTKQFLFLYHHKFLLPTLEKNKLSSAEKPCSYSCFSPFLLDDSNLNHESSLWTLQHAQFAFYYKRVLKSSIPVICGKFTFIPDSKCSVEMLAEEMIPGVRIPKQKAALLPHRSFAKKWVPPPSTPNSPPTPHPVRYIFMRSHRCFVYRRQSTIHFPT